MEPYPLSLSVDRTSPLYQKIKDHILEKINAGEWGATDRIPSENELIRQLGVSRMTVNRALRELADEGYLVRVVGVGTFVAESKIQIHPLTIRNIAEEIAERGHVHSTRIVLISQEEISAKTAQRMEMTPHSDVFHTLLVHRENGRPLQLEDRFVNPALAPDYLSCDFTRITPYEHLMQAAPLQKVEHSVEALMPPQKVAHWLDMPADEPCLLISRRTWTRERIASYARLYHPGATYRLVGRFDP